MPDEPTTAAGYGPEFLERARRTCLHVATVIGDMTDEVVLVGGLVPSLIVAQGSLPSGAERHVGTMDVDVGLAPGLLDEGRYQELSERLRRAGFGPDANESGRRTRQRWVWKDSRGMSVVQQSRRATDGTLPESVGAMRVAAFLAPQGDATFLADVAGLAREFVRLCDGGR